MISSDGMKIGVGLGATGSALSAIEGTNRIRTSRIFTAADKGTMHKHSQYTIDRLPTDDSH